MYHFAKERGVLEQNKGRHALVGPLEHWHTQRSFQIRFLRSRSLRPEHHLLDIGCGTLRGGVPLVRYLRTGHYCGIESRSEALEEGKLELQEEGLEAKQPLLLHTSNLTLPQQYDFPWAFAVLISYERPRSL
jgi:hypothetical protein